MAPFGDAVGLVARSELRRQWRALLGLALLIGLVGAVSLSGFAGARRTASALDRFRDATLARDLRVVGADDETTHRLADDLTDEPYVAAVGEYVHFITTVRETLGLTVFAGVDERFSTEVDRPIVLEGRMPDADAPDEIAVDEVSKDLLDVEVGDDLHATTFDADDVECFVSATCPFQGIPGPELTLRVVGVMRDVDAFATTADPTPTATASAAFTDAYRGRIGSLRSEAAVRLRDDDDLDELEAFVDEEERATTITPADDYAGGAEDAVDVLGTTLVVFALVSAAAGTIAAFQAVSRQVDAAAGSTTIIPALGFTPRQWALAAALPSIGAIGLGAVLAAIGAGAASGRYPVGFVASMEPDPGLRLDLPVLAGGAVAISLVVGTWAVLSARRRCVRARRTSDWVPTWPWASLPLAGGARLAFGRGRVRAAGPMRSAMVGIAIGVVGVVASSTAVVSLDRLIDDSSRWGLAWSATAQSIDPATLEPLAEQFGDRDDIEAVAILEQGLVRSLESEVSAYALRDVHGETDFRIRRGRAPTEDDEVAVGEAELDRRDLDIGDEYLLTGPDDEEHRYEIVGAAVAPPINDLRPGQGAVFTPAGLERTSIADPSMSMALTYEDEDDAEVIHREFESLGVAVLDPIIPPQLSNLDETSVVVNALIAFFIALGLVALAQGLVLSGRRHLTNLAVWRALGFTPGQVRRAVLWQSVLITAAAAVPGVLLGIYVGRVAWRLTIQNVGVIDGSTLPTLLVASTVPVALAAAVVVALVPAVLAARRRIARTLHAE